MEYYLSQIMESSPAYLSGKSYHDEQIIGATKVCFCMLYHGAPVYSYLFEVFLDWYHNTFCPWWFREEDIREQWRKLYLKEERKLDSGEKLSFLICLFCNNQFFLFRIGTGSAFVLSEHIRWITHKLPNTIITGNWEFYSGRLQEKQWFFLGSDLLFLTAEQEKQLERHWPQGDGRLLAAIVNKKYQNQDIFVVRVQEEKGVELYERNNA